MERIPATEIAASGTANAIRVPTAVDHICPQPECGRKVTFGLGWRNPSSPVATTTSRCPGCHKDSVWVLIPSSDTVGPLFVYPPSTKRSVLDGIRDVEGLDDALLRAYASAVNVFNIGEWSGTAVTARRALEGIVKSLPTDEATKRKSLDAQLKALPGFVDLQEPLLKLAHAVRKGGNLGAHFDLEKEPTAETASLILDLLDYMLEYLFILPARVKALEEHVDQLGREGNGGT